MADYSNTAFTSGEVYEIDGQMMRCRKVRASGINTFQIIDKEGNDLVLRDEKNPGMIADFGIRVIRCKKPNQ
jgi:hypothetical protein